MSSKKGGGGAGHSGKNKVNEFDEEAWSNVFNTMTKEKEGEESAESISSREAMQMVTKILDKMSTRFESGCAEVMNDLDSLKTGLDGMETTVKEVHDRINDTSYLDEGVPPG